MLNHQPNKRNGNDPDLVPLVEENEAEQRVAPEVDPDPDPDPNDGVEEAEVGVQAENLDGKVDQGAAVPIDQGELREAEADLEEGNEEVDQDLEVEAKALLVDETPRATKQVQDLDHRANSEKM